ncbi:unnamed protein product [Durusdinium trenchii]|uniref:Pseudouridine synthase RsuA/RluA-like domain-containing protein n=1 Tax=Durusdinium trenchii TaxID=1381693 RepID=A0ABP0R695_9DINO
MEFPLKLTRQTLPEGRGRTADVAMDWSNPRLATKLLVKFGNLGQWPKALGLLCQLGEGVKVDEIHMSAAIRACSKGCAWEAALALLQSASHFSIGTDLKIFCVVLSALDRGRQWELAFQLLEQMVRVEMPPEQVAYNTAVSACERLGQWKAAIGVMARMCREEVEMDTITYGTAICACARGQAWWKVLHLWQCMEEKSVGKNTVLCGASVNACAKGSLWAMALDILSSMPRSKVKQNTITCNAAISACERGAQWRFALEILRQMPRTAIPCDVISCSAAMSACEKAAEWQLAVALFEDLISCSAAISACEKAARWEVALGLLWGMDALSVRRSSVSFAAAISACEKAQEWPAAVEVLEQFLCSRVEVDRIPFGAAIAACSRSGQWLVAEAILRDMCFQKLPKDVISCTAAIAACANSAQWTRALKFMEEMVTETVHPDESTYGSALSACYLAGRWQEGLELLDEMKRADFAVDGMHIGSVVGAVLRNLGRSAAVAWLKTLREGPEEAPQPGIQLGEIIGGSPVISASYGLVILNKPAGERTEDVQLALAQRLQSSTSSVSRLDRPTSGVLTVVVGSKMAATTKWFQAQFASRLVEKEYLCLCEAHQEPGPPGSRHSVSAPLRVVSQSSWSSRTQVDESSGREALTLYEILGCFTLSGSKRFVLVRAEPKTGRMHQIRAHLASIGLPLVGDGLYGQPPPDWCRRLFLHCHRLRLLDWEAEPLQIDVPLPSELQAALEHLEATEANEKRPFIVKEAELGELDVLKQATSKLKAFSTSHQWTKALDLLALLRCSTGPKPNMITCNAASSACVHHGWSWALHLLVSAQAARLRSDLVSCNVALKARAQWVDAMASLEQMCRSQTRPDLISYNSLVHQLEATQWSRALGIWGEIQADVRDVVTFASIASSCAKARQWRHELRLLSSLWGSACELDAITFNAITSGLPESQAWSKGQHLLSKVQFLLLQVNEISYHAAISCQEFWRRAINLCGKLREDGLKPNIVTCNSISSTCQAEWQQVMLALNTFADIGLELDIISFNVAISACGMKTLWELAWSLFQELSASGMADPYTFTTMIKTCAATHWWHVLSLLEASHSLGPSLEVWNAAISSCSNASAWLQALLVYGAMQQQQVLPDVASYSQVIMACDEGSQHALALSFLEELEADSLRPDVVAFGSAMNACAHCGELNKALELLNRMQECQVQANLMVANTVINSCVLTGSWEEALKLLSEFQKALQMDVISYNSLLSALAPSGLWTRAVDVLEEARSRGLTMDMISSNALMSACENRARWQEALQLMNSYEWSAPPAEKPRLSQIIITNTALAASARSGQWLLALSSFSELSQEALQPSHVSYNAVVSACEKGRRWWLALDLYQHLLDSKLPLDVATCNSAALACAAAGQWQEALLLAMTSSSVASLSGAITASAELMQGNEQVMSLLSGVELQALTELASLASVKPEKEGAVSRMDRTIQLRASMAQWHESFLEHLALQRKKRLRARALLALALISEPMERQWKEIFVDVAWTAWVQVVGDERRQREMCKAQQMYEKVLNDAHSAMGLTCLTVWSSRAILPFRFSSDTLLALLQKALPSVPPKDLEVVAESVPKELDGQTSFFQLMSWLYPSAKQAIDIEEWQALRRQHCSWAKRCHSLLVLSLIAEPFQHFWREVFLDLAWSAWAGAVAGTRRRRSLCVAQAEFESEADRLSALCGNQVSPQDVASTALHNILVRCTVLQRPFDARSTRERGG